ncbi:MAG TPA: Calx-beta domain-containing protein [Parvularculaceae bacterium]|nr:Calx-beta domain-containing protein [Parvularculaceae bacterium]
MTFNISSGKTGNRAGLIGLVRAALISLAICPAIAAPARAQAVYEYDDVGRLVRVIHADTNTETDYAYDPAGNRTAVTTAVPSPPEFSIDGASGTEGDALTFTIHKSHVTATAFSVQYATANGTAGVGDFTAASGTLTFAPQDVTRTVVVQTTQDSAYESPESFQVVLSAPSGGATITTGLGSATGSITDNDPAPSFAIANASVTEGGVLSFTVTKTGASALSHVLNFASTNGTAIAGSDYTAASGSVTFAPADTTKAITVATSADSAYELNENMTMTISAPTNGAVISTAQATGTIVNDDPTPSFTISDASATEGGSLVFTVTRNGASSFTHAVSYATANGSAAAGTDYVAASGTLTFLTTDTAKTITVATVDDTAHEATETFNVNLSGATNGATISDATGVGTILDNDAANSAPIVQNESITINKLDNIFVDVLANDSDPDGDPLTISSYTVSSSTGLSVTQETTGFNVTGLAAGNYTINYVVSDGRGGTGNGVLSVSVKSLICCSL